MAWLNWKSDLTYVEHAWAKACLQAKAKAKADTKKSKESSAASMLKAFAQISKYLTEDTPSVSGLVKSGVRKDCI